MIWSADWTFAHLTKLHKQQPKLVDAALQGMIAGCFVQLGWDEVFKGYALYLFDVMLNLHYPVGNHSYFRQHNT